MYNISLYDIEVDHSELQRNVRMQLSLEVFVAIMVQSCIVSFWLLQALSIGSSKYVVSQYSLAETSVTGKRISQLDIFFALLFDHFAVNPFFIFFSKSFSELCIFS